jgi:hypothetical protein
LPDQTPLAERKKNFSMTPPEISNPSYSGLEADQKVIAAHGCYAMTATTALTAQNTKGVLDIHQIPPEFVKKQIDACIDDIGVDVIKTGILAPRDLSICEVIFNDKRNACIKRNDQCCGRRNREMESRTFSDRSGNSALTAS